MIIETKYATLDRDELKRLQADSLTFRALLGGHEVEGFALVPVEPTREMWAASGDAIVALQDSGHFHHDIITGAVYRAMLAAAPKGDSHE